MSLSNYERRVLDEIEAALAAENARSKTFRRRTRLLGYAALLGAFGAASLAIAALGAIPAVGAAALSLIAGVAVGAGAVTFLHRWRLTCALPRTQRDHRPSEENK